MYACDLFSAIMLHISTDTPRYTIIYVNGEKYHFFRRQVVDWAKTKDKNQGKQKTWIMITSAKDRPSVRSY